MIISGAVQGAGGRRGGEQKMNAGAQSLAGVCTQQISTTLATA